jgi:thiol:disulfide interchange protein
MIGNKQIRFRIVSLIRSPLVRAGLACALLATASHADGNTAKTKQLEVRIASEQSAIQPNADFTVGLDFKVQPGWHIYWINPGDSGQTPTIQWSLPPGVSAGSIQWPKPQKITFSEVALYGYGDAVLLPIPMHAGPGVSVGKPLKMTGEVTWLVCREVCIPGKAMLQISIPTAQVAQVDPERRAQFESARAAMPLPAPADWKASARSDGDSFTLNVTTGRPEQSAVFFPLEPNQIDNVAAQKFDSQSQGLTLKIKSSDFATTAPADLQGLLVFPSGKSFIIDAPVQVTAAAEAVAGNETRLPGFRSLLATLGFAFLGGLILNLMPCVLPVLSLKVFGLGQMGGSEAKRVRIHGLFYTFGILVSFWLLVAVLEVLRAAGRQVGWGFQMQSPVFLVFLTALMFLLALNLLGVFDIVFSWMGMGHSLTARSGYSGPFFTGVLATIVATPCTAPFMGAAIGFALTQSSWIIFLVFTSLALGLAAPFLLLSFEPRWARILPKSGKWMNTFKQALSFPLFGAAIWLIWVFGQERGVNGAGLLLAGLLIISIGVWSYGVMRRPVLRVAVVLILLTVGLGLPISMSLAPTPAVSAATGAQASEGLRWESFSPEKLSEYRAESKPVLVDFTAAWCLSCQVNERAVFHSGEVQKRLERGDIALMKADWTSYDPTITKALAQYDRSGVPFYLMFGATQKPVIATEILTPQALLKAIDDLQPAGKGI